jgi:hypothetical protein
MTADDRFDKLEQRVSKLEDKLHESDLSQMRQYGELEKLIAKAVSEGNRDIAKVLEEHNTRICNLEHKDGENAKLILKSIGATTVGWLVLGILNNGIAFFGK